jgi:DNA polymerase III subunit delta
MDAMDFLEGGKKFARYPVYAIFGDEDFLKRRCRQTIISRLLGDADPEFAVTSMTGDSAEFPEVRSELETLPFLAPMRIVHIEQADDFVSENRPALEKYVAAPSSSGVLILEANTFSEATNLAKSLPTAAKLVCKAPPNYKLTEVESWCVRWCESQHQKKLTRDAAAMLVERIGVALGLLDQEIAKLATTIGARTTISPEDVEKYVPKSRDADVFLILSAIAAGQTQLAFATLGELLDQGESPIGILGALSYTLRKQATVGELLNQGIAFGPAMDAAGVPKWPKARQEFEKLARHLGRKRLAQIPDWLIETNLGLKGSNPLPDRLQLELLLTKLARKREG